MEDHGLAFFEEPCEFDDLWATKEVTDVLSIQLRSANRSTLYTAGDGVSPIAQPTSCSPTFTTEAGSSARCKSAAWRQPPE